MEPSKADRNSVMVVARNFSFTFIPKIRRKNEMSIQALMQHFLRVMNGMEIRNKLDP
jgi:hypothetical protein